MVYRFAVDRADYGDLASGAVLRSAPGFPGFPVRLASEMFQRAAALHGGSGPLTVWDPCCGSGYLLTVVGLLHRDRIGAVLATDVSDRAIEIASANLGLLHPDGLAARADELSALSDKFDKQSHRDAVESAHRLSEGLTGSPPHITTAAVSVFDADRLVELVGAARPDIVLTDVPYGEQTEWTGGPASEPVAAMLDTLVRVLPPTAVIAVSGRGRKIGLGVPPTQSFKVGTRSVALLAPGRVRPGRSRPGA